MRTGETTSPLRGKVAARVAASFRAPLASPVPRVRGLRSAKAASAVQAGGDARGAGESGFTLIEVLVALTILSISLATLLAIFLQGLVRAKESSDEGAARSLAQSLLSQAKAAPSLAYGSTAGKINQ